jgi:hypothetical protein
MVRLHDHCLMFPRLAGNLPNVALAATVLVAAGD